MRTSVPAPAIAASLAEGGVRYLFGVPGGGNNLDVIGACDEEAIRFVLAHTETGAAIMASAHAELAGAVGACVVTRGPGAASAVNGAAQAQQDRQPLLVLSDTVDEQSAPRIAHQNIDQHAMFAPVTKWSATVGSDEPEQVVRDAIRTATSPARGAVHLDIDPTSKVRDGLPSTPSASGSMLDVAALVTAARRPVVLVGLGARGHTAAVREIIADTAIPVMTTYKAKGMVPDSGPNAAGTLTGARRDAAVLGQADLIVAVGLDSIELIPNPWPYRAATIALAEYADPARYFRSDVEVIGALDDLLPHLPMLSDTWPTDFVSRQRELADEALASGPNPAARVAPWEVVRIVRDHARPDSVATVDAGAHMLVAMALWKTDAPGQILISSGLATMGYALPAAVGAALAEPNVRIYCFVGDGGLMMSLGELETVARLRLPITVVVFNDNTLSLIQAKQKAEGHGGPTAVRYSRTDFAAVASGLGLAGIAVETERELDAALASDVVGPVLLDVRVDPRTYRHVLDVVRGGAST